VGEACKILIADRNRHVRDLLRRELMAEGYSVEVAKDGHEVWLMINGGNPPDLVILDLEIPFLEDLVELAHLREGEPSVPLIIFSFFPDEDDRIVPKAAAFLEKKEDTNHLKEVVAEVIGRLYPNRLTSQGS
jgi:DNA-binding response OmpR family regulator